jgi:hypothetical protein
MNYKRENITSQIPLFDTWNEWTKNHQYNRAALIGLGVYLNSIEGTLRQTRRSLAPSATGQTAPGVVFYAMANTNEAVSANPHSIPPGQNTPKRSFAEFASGLKTGKSVSGTTLYEDPTANPIAVFGQPASVPVFSWKAAPTKGHLMGFARRDDDTPLDTAVVTIKNLETGAVRSTATDGGGFYGGVDLTPGQYLVKAVLNNETLYSCGADVAAGAVTTADLQPDATAPTLNLTANPNRIFPPNGQSVTVTLSGVGSDMCSGLASISYVVTDEYGTSLSIPTRTLNGSSASWTDSLIVQARRRGNDSDGRLYRVTATITDVAGNTSTSTTDIVISHDQRNK